MPRDELKAGGGFAFWSGLASALFAPLILIVAVLGSILAGLASPSEAAGVGAIGALMLAGYKLDARHRQPIIYGFLALMTLLALAGLFDLRLQRTEISDLEWGAIIIAMGLSCVLAWGIICALRSTYGAPVDGQDEGQKKPLSVLEDVNRQTLNISTMVFIILVGASMFSLVFRGFQGDQYIERFLSELGGGTLAAVLLVMAVMFVLGFFLDFLEIVFIVVPIVAPILLQMDFAGQPMSPVWLGVMMGINLQTSFLTPPFGFALFYLRGVAPDEVRTMDIYRGVLPFVGIQILALVLLWYFPEIATWLPTKFYGP